MKIIFALFTVISSGAFAGWLISTKPKDVCNSIGDVGLRIECDKHVTGKSFNEEYLDRCLTVSKIIKKVPTGNNWQTVLDCLDGVAGKTKNSISKAQLETCEKLESSNKASYVTTCLTANFDNGLFEVCTKPLKLSNYEASGTCMDSIKTFPPYSEDAVTARQNCFEKNSKGNMRVNTWSEVSTCFREAAPEPETAPVRPAGKSGMGSHR